MLLYIIVDLNLIVFVVVYDIVELKENRFYGFNWKSKRSSMEIDILK